MKKTIKVVQLIRTSTPEQNPQRQIEELDELCKKNNWTVVESIVEVGSGSKKNKDRASINRILELAKKGSMDKLITIELSRIGRRTGESVTLCETLADLGVSVYEKARNIETLNDDGTPNAISSMILSVLASLHSMESAERNARIKSGMASAKKRGVHCGRDSGTEPISKFLSKHKPIVKSFEKGENLSLRKRANLYDVSVNTVVKIQGVLTRSGPE
jgi:DNA invertase Pin-like site-specific DNA recombinase